MRNSFPHRPPHIAQQSGFGLIEVLVAMAIGLIGMLAIMQAFSMNERYKENTVGASGSQTNGSIALFTMERDVRMAGYGITNSSALGCSTVQYHYDGNYSSPPGPGGAGALPTLRLVPVYIEPSDPADLSKPYSITTLASSNAYRTSPATITDNMPKTSAELKVSNGLGFDLGDLAIAMQGTTCSLMEITNIQDPASHYQHHPTGTYNPPGGVSLLPGYTVGAQVMSLGKPLMRRYEVSSNNLTVADWNMLLTSATPTVLVDEIVNLQAQYGKDSDGDTIVDTYDATMPASANEWMQVLALRMAVLARGAYERPAADGTCTATVTMPTWAGGTIRDPNVTAGDPSCYRYRVFETTVPLRNMIWRSDR
ncbi:MAG TPA: PilW family protein [Rhodocyclaceae bacterium]|nr:PilW family protein [Rhodocyclaceae bacterium]